MLHVRFSSRLACAAAAEFKRARLFRLLGEHWSGECQTGSSAPETDTTSFRDSEGQVATIILIRAR